VEWYHDDETRTAVWDRFATGPEPVGYDPSIIPMWADGPGIRSVRRATAGAVSAAGDARHVDYQGEGSTLNWTAP